MSANQRQVSRDILHPLLAVAFINFVLVVIMLVMATTIFANPAGIDLRFTPSPLEGRNTPPTIITVTSENVIYLDGKVVTINDLRRSLAGDNFRGSVIFIRADRRSSMGRVADILNLCRGIPGATVNVSAVF